MTAQESLTVSGSSIDNTAGTFGTVSGPLTLTTPGALINTNGNVLAGSDAFVQAGSIDSTNGTLSAADTASVNASGAIVNQGGSIVGGARTTLTAASLDNRNGGTVGTQTGPIDVTTTGAVQNEAGRILASGSMSVSAGSIGNDQGTIGSGADAQLVSSAGLSNAGGNITAVTSLTAQAASIENTHGATLGSQQGPVLLSATGAVSNTDSKLLSGKALTVHASDFHNDGGETSAAGTATVTATNAITNNAGTLAASDAVQLTAARLANQGGTIGSVNGTLTATLAGAIDNSANGKLLAKGEVNLTGSSLNNTDSTVAGRNVSVNTGAGTVENAGGTIAANAALDVRSGQLNNEGGVLESTGSLTANTHGRTLDNSNAGKVLGASVELATGVLNNAAGLVSSRTNAQLNVASLANGAGSVIAGRTLGVASAGAISNAGGQIGGNTDVSLSGTAIDNTAGAMHAGGTLSVTGHTVTNANTLDATVTTATGAAPMAAGMQGGNLALTANQSLDNTNGQARADQQMKVTTASLTNTGGRIETPGSGISYGTSDTKNTSTDAVTGAQGSLIGSTNGSVNLHAGGNLHVTGSDLIAAQNVTGIGANVTLDAATGTRQRTETQETKTSGFTLGLAGSIGNAINTTVGEAHAASASEDGRAVALHSIAAAGATGNAVAGQVLKPGQKPDIGVQLTWGTSQSNSAFTENQTTNSGTNVLAGGTASFTATGNGTPGSGNVTVAGSTVNAHDVVFDAKNQVNLVNTTQTDSTRSSNSSSTASVGVSYSAGSGFGVSASMSNAHGDANSDAVTQNNTHINGAHSVTIRSGGDTNIIGSNVSGGGVKADVGGNLNIASVQDTTESAAHQSSTSGGFSISQYGGGGASFSAQHGNANGNYAGVNEQAGIHAGSGGFDINVKGNTDLKGAYIASDADPSKNSLTTGTLTFSDIQNHADYSASSSGVTIGGAGLGIAPMIPQSDSGSQSATTRSGVSAGSLMRIQPVDATQ